MLHKWCKGYHPNHCFSSYCLNFWSSFIALVEKHQNIFLVFATSLICTVFIFFGSLLWTVLWLYKITISLNIWKPALLLLVGITAHGYAKILLLKSYISAYNLDIICLSKTDLGPNAQWDDYKLGASGYNSVCSDHSSKNKQGDVCVNYKTFRSVQAIDNCILQYCISFEGMIGEKCCSFVVLYRSPRSN